MRIEKTETPDFEKIGANDAWPEWDEDAYVQGANNQMDAARKAVQGQGELGKMSATVDENMQGQFATAATETFVNRSAKLVQREGTHTGNALVMGLSAQNIVNTKTLLNATAAKVEGTVEAAKVRWLTSGATQDEIEKEYNTIIDEGKQAVEKIKDNYTQTEESLNSQLNSGETPEVPSTMPGAPEGGSAPTLDGLDPDVQSAMGNALGTGSGGGGDMSSMMGMAQGLISPLTGALSSPPGMDTAQQMGQQGMQMLQGLLGQGGDQVTPEQLDELLANQGESEGEGEKPEPREKLENPDRPESPPPGAPGAPGAPGGPGGPGAPGGDGPAASPASNTTTDDAPSPAAEPVSAAPPASAMQPAVELSSDPNAGNSPQASAANTGTQLSSGAAATATQAAPGTLGAPAQGLGSGAGLGAPAGGAPMGGGVMGGAPMMGAPMTATSAGGAAPVAGTPAPAAPLAPAQGAPAQGAPAAGAPAAGAPLAPATPPASGAAPQSGALGTPATAGGAQQTQQPAAAGAGVGAVPVTSPNPATAGEMFRTSTPFSVDERAAGTIMAALGAQYARGGFTTPIAVAIMTDGTSVYCTADGLGYIPAGTHLPADTLPLSEFPSAQALFRADWTGCVRPGYVLKLAADVGLIPAVKVIVATDDIETEGVTRVTRDMLKGAPHIECPITRDMFAKLEADDAPLAMVGLAQEWNYDPADHDAEDVSLALVESRWENDGSENAVRALAHHMLMDAHIALTGGQTQEAAYILKQLLDVPTV